jgi:predicted ATP-dependent protease
MAGKPRKGRTDLKKSKTEAVPVENLSEVITRQHPEYSESEKNALLEAYQSLIMSSVWSLDTPEEVYARTVPSDDPSAFRRAIYSPEREIQLAATLMLFNVDEQDPEYVVNKAQQWFSECAKDRNPTDVIVKACSTIAASQKMKDLYALVQEHRKADIDRIRAEKQKLSKTFTQTLKSVAEKQKDKDDKTEEQEAKKRH